MLQEILLRYTRVSIKTSVVDFWPIVESFSRWDLGNNSGCQRFRVDFLRISIEKVTLHIDCSIWIRAILGSNNRNMEKRLDVGWSAVYNLASKHCSLWSVNLSIINGAEFRQRYETDPVCPLADDFHHSWINFGLPDLTLDLGGGGCCATFHAILHTILTPLSLLFSLLLFVV